MQPRRRPLRRQGHRPPRMPRGRYRTPLLVAVDIDEETFAIARGGDREPRMPNKVWGTGLMIGMKLMQREGGMRKMRNDHYPWLTCRVRGSFRCNTVMMTAKQSVHVSPVYNSTGLTSLSTYPTCCMFGAGIRRICAVGSITRAFLNTSVVYE